MNSPDPRLLTFAMEQSVESQSDVLGALRFCERQLLDPGGDPADVMTGTARVLAVTPSADRPRPIVPALMARFGLTAVEACQVIAMANRRAPG